ncbi:lipase family protein [Williamsia deligens]|uniref:lipase family protein n=1 Tax=Williamsia deligens TaxID=321325 RepID=UPI002646F869
MGVAAVCAGLTSGLLAPVATAAPQPSPPSIAPPPPFGTVPLPPELDPRFYAPPAGQVASAQPGQILAARRISLAAFSVVPIAVDAWQVSYRSTNTRGAPIPAVATLITPRGTNPAKTRRLVSWQSAEDSTAQYCAPSYVLQQGSVPGPVSGSVDSSLEVLQIASLLATGSSVVVADHEGPQSAFAAGPLAGRIVLDGIRAARSFTPLGLAPDARIGMIGYSGGAIATGWAAELQQSYAPELHITAAAEGGVPADIRALVDLANRNLGSGLIMAGIIGVSREYPELARFIAARVNPLGRALLSAKNPLCLAYQATLAPFVDIKGLFVGPGDPLDQPVPRRVLGRLKLGSTVPTMPLFVYQSHPDWIAPVGPVDALVRTYCAAPGARVEYLRDHFSEHISLAVVGFLAAMLWLNDRLDGKPARTGCSTNDVGTIAGDPRVRQAFVAQVGDVLGGIVQRQLGNPPRR